MSSSIKQNLAADQIIRINDFDPLGLVQSFTWTPSLGATPDLELGNRAKVGTSYEGDVTASLRLKSTGNLPGVLARCIASRNPISRAFQGYQFNPNSLQGKNGYTLTQDDFTQVRADLLLYERPDGVSFSRATWLPRMQLSSLSGSVSASGAASETLTFSGTTDVGFPQGYHDIRSIPCTVASSTSLELTDSSVTPVEYTLAFVTVDKDRFRNETKGDATYFTLGAGVCTLTSSVGYSIPTDADCHALVYRTSPSTTLPSLSTATRGTSATSVRGNKINIYVAPNDPASPTSPELWLAAQTLTWTIPFGLVDLRQIAYTDRNSATYAKAVTLPLKIAVEMTVYETDWEEWGAVVNNTFGGGSAYDETLEFVPSAVKTGFAVVVDYFTKDGIALMRLTFPDMSPAGRAKRVAIPGRAQLSWSFTGSLVTIEGYNTEQPILEPGPYYNTTFFPADYFGAEYLA